MRSCILSAYHSSKCSTLQWTMQLWRPHSLSYYLPDQPNYLVLIILSFVPGNSCALPGDLVSHYEPCSPKHPGPPKNHFACFCEAAITSNCDFFNYKVYLNKPSTFFVALNLQRNFTKVWCSSSFSTMKTPVLCVRQMMLCTLTFYCLWDSLTELWLVNRWDMDWISGPCSG